MDGQAPVGGPLAGDRGWGSAPARVLDDDFDLDAHFARLARETDAARAQWPSAASGPEGLGGQARTAAFGQDGAADVLRLVPCSRPSPLRPRQARDTAVWTTPSGRTHTTTATAYDL